MRRGVNRAIYFDSFGNLRQPRKLMLYLGAMQIEYNRTSHQHYAQRICEQ